MKLKLISKKICLSILVVCCMLSSVNYTHAKKVEAKEQSFNESESTSMDGLFSEEEIFLENEFAAHYFYNLRENYGYNYFKSCSYVALGMLLSYYDTYWDDTIIEPDYEADVVLSTNNFTASINSPGIRSDSEIEELQGNLTAQQYKNLVQRNYQIYFHMQLIKMGIDMGLYNNYDEISSYGLTDAQVVSLVNHFIYNFKFYTTNTVCVESVLLNQEEIDHFKQDKVVDFVRDKVEQGIPVLVCAESINDLAEKHAMVVYDYDKETNIFYTHLGKENQYYHVSTIDAGYDLFTAAIAINTKTTHTYCSNNYKYIGSTNITYYCPCSNQTFYQGKVIFENINCFGSNAIITNGNSVINDSNPLVFNYGQAISLANATAQITNYGNGPVFIFLGWYTDKTFTNKATQVSSIEVGDYKVYAKWRVDYKWISLNRTLNVTKDKIDNNPYDQFTLCTAQHLSQFSTDMGITKLTIEFYISIKEIRNGTQYLYFYGGTSGTEFLGSTTFEATNEYDAYKVRFTVDISKLGGNPVVYMKYKTSKSGFLNLVKDEWQTNQYFAEISFVVNESDITGDDALDFVWHHENSLARQMN